VEIQDIDFPIVCDDGSIHPDSNLRNWSNLMMEAGERSGFSLNTCGHAAEMMSAAGFVDIVRIPFKWPINRWPRDPRHKAIGAWAEANFSIGIETMTMALFTRFMGWSKEDVEGFSEVVVREFRDVRNHGYFNLFVTYGRKPTSS